MRQGFYVEYRTECNIVITNFTTDFTIALNDTQTQKYCKINTNI